MILRDTVHFQDLQNTILALDFTTGAVKLSRFRNVGDAVGPDGVAVAFGKVYAVKDLCNMTALNFSYGEEARSARVSSIIGVSNLFTIESLPTDDRSFIWILEAFGTPELVPILAFLDSSQTIAWYLLVVSVAIVAFSAVYFESKARGRFASGSKGRPNGD